MVSKTGLTLWGTIIFASVLLDEGIQKYGGDIQWVRPMHYCYPPLLAMLFASQLWATWILRSLGNASRKFKKDVALGERGVGTAQRDEDLQPPNA